MATAISSGEGRLTTSLAAGEIRAASERAFGEIRHELASGFGASNVSIEKTAAANGVAVEKVGTAVALGQKDILLAVFKDGCETREKAAANFAALQLQACEDKHALSAQIAECCCEQKALTISENNATRALIFSEGQRRLESENANLRLELALKNNSGKKE